MSDNTSLPMRIAAGRWVRHAFLRENLVSALKTFAWLGPMTLLIWVYAERAQVVQMEDVPFPIGVRSEDPNRFVRLDPTFEGNVVATLSGPRSRIEAVRQDIRPDANNGPEVIINVDSRLNNGTVTFDAISEINQSEAFRYSGVNVTELRPAQIKVFVDTYEEREFDVQVPASVTNLASVPAFVPAKVKVRAPSSYFEKHGTVTVEADLASTRVLDRPGPHPVTPRVYSPQLENYTGVTYSPASVAANLDVRPKNSKFVFNSLPVWLLTPPGEIRDACKVTHPPAVFNVEVSGPPDKIALIERGEVKFKAYLVVTSDDVPASDAGPKTFRRGVEFDRLPEGVVVTEPPEDFDVKVERVTP